MTTITFKGNPIQINGEIPSNASKAIDFELVASDLSTHSLSNYNGKRIVLNIFPSVDTGVCAASVRQFNQFASSLENTVVLCISRDLPFAQKRFCGAENIENVVMLSDFASGSFGKAYGIEMLDGPLKNLHARAVVVLDENHTIVYQELVPEITQEPDYAKAIQAL
jgi:thioredoxin-dependent peroxiredoxin